MDPTAFESLVEQASDIIYRVDRSGRICYVNAAVTGVLGYARDDVVGKRIVDFIAPGSVRSILSQYGRQVRGGDAGTYTEVPILSASGRIVWLGQHVHVVARKGRIEAVEGVARDISEHRRLADLQIGQKSLLELVARGKPLIDSLDTLAYFLEGHIPDVAVALLVLDSNQNLIRPLVAPGLTDDEVQVLESVWDGNLPLPEALDIPSRERVRTHILNEPAWSGFRYKSCWATPVLSTDRRANGILVLFQYGVGEPGDDDYRLLDVSAQIAGIAIERDRFERTARRELKRQVAARTAELEQSNRKLRHEVAERMEAERALRTSESLLKEAERIAHLGSWSWTSGEGVQLWSDETYRIFGVPQSSFEPTLRTIGRMIHPDDRRRIYALFSMGTDGGVRSGEFRILRPDGEERIVEMEFSGGADDPAGRLIGVLHDITEQRVLEKELLKAGERERKRVGRDLHDGLGQLLTGVGYLSKTLAQMLEAREDDLAGEAGEITELVEEAIDHTRSLSKLLLPVELEENGLEAALQRLRSHVEGVYHIACRLKTDSYRPIQDPEIALHMYRVAQEAVHNAVRHGRPERVDVTLASRRGRTVLTVLDDGIGLPEGVDQRGGGLGLRTMQYRAQTIGAVLSIGRRRTGGTRVVCELPTHPEGHPHTLLQPS
jgi:PAS domain S-box-containing protein